MNRNWKNVPIPAKMKYLDFDAREYPIPYVVLRGKDGKAYFQINDETKVARAIQLELCAVCGTRMKAGDKWVVGGAQSAFHPQGAYIDTPTHYECLHYALQVCPYLAYTKYSKRIDLSNVNIDNLPEQILAFQDPTVDDLKVPFFVAAKITGFKTHRPTTTQRYLVPNRPFQKVEFWRDGVQITRDQARALYDAHQLENGVEAVPSVEF